MTSAVIIRAALPPALERLRLASVADAARGVPAHLTLLYPFVAWDSLDASVARRVAEIAAAHEPFAYTLTGAARWHDTVYVAVEPVEPFVVLQADLAGTFPDYPIYGAPADFAFVPHVTVAEGRAVNDAETIRTPAWSDLPARRTADALEVIATDGGPWQVVWRIPLGRAGRP
jgi:2'-5' RNA ligase